MNTDWREECEKIHSIVVKRWQAWSPEDQRFLTLALAGEVGEFANIMKKIWRGDPEPEGGWNLAEELADIRIYLELLAVSFNVDLDDACTEKTKELYRRWPEANAADERAV